MNPAFLLGLTVSGVPVTLLRCSYSASRGAIGLPTATVITAETMLWGVLADDRDMAVPELWVRYGDLEQWVGHSPAILDPFLKDEIRRPLTDFKTTLLATEEMTIEVQLRTYTSFSQEELHAQDRAHIIFRPPAPLAIEKYGPWLLRFRTLLVVATSAQTAVKEVLTQVDRKYEVKGSVRSHKVSVPIFGLGLSVPLESKYTVHRHRMLFNLRELGTHAPELIEGWYSRALVWEPALNLYAYTAHRSDMIVEEAFLNAVRACESFHRLEFGGSDLELEQHDLRLAEIINSAPPQYRRWLETKLCFSNEPSLRRRLTDLWARCGTTLTDLLPVRRKSLISRVVAARNYLTHFSREAAETAPSVSELPSLTRWCLILLEFSMLLSAGLPRDQLEKCARRNRELKSWRYLETRDIEYRDC